MKRTLIQCKDCGWKGTQEECNWDEEKGEIGLTEFFCPKCDGKNLIVLRGRLIPMRETY